LQLNPKPHCIWIKRAFSLKTEISVGWFDKIFIKKKYILAILFKVFQKNVINELLMIK
jgi:hypothetical protein